MTAREKERENETMNEGMISVNDSIGEMVKGI